MGNKIPLEEIIEDSNRAAYTKLVDLNKNRRDRSIITWICSSSGFELEDFMDWYEKRRTFSDKQLKFIDDVYGKVESHRTANERYAQEGYRNQLIQVMEQIADASKVTTKNVRATRGQLRAKITELKHGQMIYNRYFAVTNDRLNMVPREQRQQFSDKLNFLENKYWEIYREVRTQP